MLEKLDFIHAQFRMGFGGTDLQDDVCLRPNFLYAVDNFDAGFAVGIIGKIGSLAGAFLNYEVVTECLNFFNGFRCGGDTFFAFMNFPWNAYEH